MRTEAEIRAYLEHHRGLHQQAMQVFRTLAAAADTSGRLGRAEEDMLDHGTIVALLEWVLGERHAGESLRSISDR